MAPLCLNCSTLPGDRSLGTRSPVPCNGSRALGPFDPQDLNLTDEELRLKYLGPQQTELFVPICVTYLLIFVVGAVGNTLTCMVILRHRTMRTPTNYYLFSLAVSDLLVLLLGLPLELYEMWRNYPFLLGPGGCYFRTLLFETVCLASVLNVTALSIGRYVAVVHPLQVRSVVTHAHVRRVLGAIWGLALLCSLPNTSLHGIRQLDVPCRGTVPDSAVCTLVHRRALYNLVVQVTALLFFCLPMATISVLYLLIGLRLRRDQLLIRRQEAKGRARTSNGRRLQLLQDRGRTQLSWSWCLGSAGPRSTSTASCGALCPTGPRACTWPSSTCTSSPASSSTLARPPTLCSTASCPAASGTPSGRPCAWGPGAAATDPAAALTASAG
ncbi:neuromedin-U receptor 1 isoform X2 [Delphinapterus leucas]|uniref:Neuromedin-U receptor 1 isoform X2 n=1 Tax=Delphinapterus leucas TaxID=9749 RepID=A0A2Y9MNX7_DELLE|nr:neuromedin-U receptor 1 isoform X2 [Delphinapterus leucas]